MTVKEGQLALCAEGPVWRSVAGTLPGDVLVAQQYDRWPRLKACRNHPCAVAFYDSSKNQSRVWHLRLSQPRNLRASRARRREGAS
jgi:CGNR zinc finger